MKTTIKICLSALCLLTVGCQALNFQSTQSSRAELISENLTKLDGVWISDGYGYIIEQTKDIFRFYHVTPDVCVAADVTDTSLADVFDLFRIDRENQRVFFSSLTEPQEYVFHRANIVPELCKEGTPATVSGTIDAVISFMETHYAFFDARGVDWAAASQRLSNSKATVTSDVDLYEVIRRELAPLNDAHVELNATIDGKAIKFDADPGIIRDTLTQRAELSNTSYREQASQFNQTLWVTGIGKTILNDEGQSAGNDRIRYGMASDTIGYLAIKSMGGFIEEADTPLTEAQTFELALDGAMNLFEEEEAEAVIVDISLNSGGYGYLSRQLAERFVERTTHVSSLYAWSAKEKLKFKSVINPSDRPRYDGEVFVLTSQASVSAADFAAMCFDATDDVQIAGEPTRGALSTKLAKLLPNGWELLLSNEVILDHRGQVVETIGVVPDIPIDVFPSTNLEKGHLSAVRRLIAYINNSFQD